MEEMVYLNGDLMPGARARISPFDHGFLYGYGLFETMRAYSGRIFRLDRHLSRLRKSAGILGIAERLASYDLERACCDTLEANGLHDARLRLTVSAGEGDIVPDPDACRGITACIVARKLRPLTADAYNKGFSAVISSLPRNSLSPLSRLKPASYMENVLARREARKAGAGEALILNEQGQVAEGSTSNIFLVSRGVLVTPSVASGVLPGITREAVLELARSAGVETAEREVALDELVQAEEAFLTSSIIEIMPLTMLGDRPVGRGGPGTLTRQLMLRYRDLVKEEISCQGIHVIREKEKEG